MPDTPSRLIAFLAELRRRRVFRVAVVYAGVAFIVIQIIDGAFDYLKIPEWIGSLIIIMLAVGFPIAVGMAWAFDLTAEGLVRTRESKRDQPKKPPRPIIGNKTVAVIAVLGDQDAAIDQLEVLLSIPSTLTVPLLKLDPQWDPLREHPRFKGLVGG